MEPNEGITEDIIAELGNTPEVRELKPDWRKRQIKTDRVAMLLIVISLIALGFYMVSKVVDHRVRVPDLVGKTYGEAREIMSELDLVVKNGISVTGEFKSEYRIYRQSPTTGKVKPGSEIVVDVTSPPVQLPDLSQLELAEAIAKLQDLKIHVKQIRKEYSESIAPDCVIRIDAPSQVPQDTGVVLVIASAENDTLNVWEDDLMPEEEETEAPVSHE